MLRTAYEYKEELNKKLVSIAFNDKYKYYPGQYWDYEVEVEKHSWNKLQMVSIDPSSKEILGYFSCGIDRISHKAMNVGAIRFCGDINLIFSKDFNTFLNELFIKHKFRKAEWWVMIGNPAEKMYDKIIEKYGGTMCGYKKESMMTPDMILCDVKEYEIFREDYIKKLEELEPRKETENAKK